MANDRQPDTGVARGALDDTANSLRGIS